jgi:hypothetical protein
MQQALGQLGSLIDEGSVDFSERHRQYALDQLELYRVTILQNFRESLKTPLPKHYV